MNREYFWASKEARSKDPSRVGMVQLALPILLEFALHSTVNMMDVAFLSRVSDSAVNAVSVSGQYIMLFLMACSTVASGTIVCVNQAIGMKNLRKVNMLASIALVVNTLLGILFGVLFLNGSDVMLKIMSLEPASKAAAGRYMRIAGGLMVFQAVSFVLNSLCRSMGRTRAPLLINLTVNTINVVGNYLVVFHPELVGNIDPVTGVAIASVLGCFCGLVLSVTIVLRTGLRPSLRLLRPFPMQDFKLALSIGIPGGISNLAYFLSQIATTAILSLTGETMMAAKVYVSNVVQYIALVGMAFSQANTIMVGYRVGAGKFDEAREIRALVTKIALLSNMMFSLLLILVNQPVMRLFTDNPVILQMASRLIMLDFAVEIGRALNNSISGALQATGDVNYQLVVNQSSAWIVSVGGSYLLGIVCGLGLYGVWIAFAADELFRGLVLLRRWRSGKWQPGAEERRKIISAERGA
ncbi:MAG: MATE family efflux transporter [Clostridia bacterium]|nr:MATE family efflux transporter [Clostridia bacterium]